MPRFNSPSAGIGRSNIVGKPISLLLLAEHATVTMCHSRTVDLPSVTREADVLVAAVGKAEAVTAMVRGPVTTRMPASFLQLHGDVEVVLDEAAAVWAVTAAEGEEAPQRQWNEITFIEPDEDASTASNPTLSKRFNDLKSRLPVMREQERGLAVIGLGKSREARIGSGPAMELVLIGEDQVALAIDVALLQVQVVALELVVAARQAAVSPRGCGRQCRRGAAALPAVTNGGRAQGVNPQRIAAGADGDRHAAHARGGAAHARQHRAHQGVLDRDRR